MATPHLHTPLLSPAMHQSPDLPQPPKPQTQQRQHVQEQEQASAQSASQVYTLPSPSPSDQDDALPARTYTTDSLPPQAPPEPLTARCCLETVARYAASLPEHTNAQQIARLVSASYNSNDAQAMPDDLMFLVVHQLVCLATVKPGDLPQEIHRIKALNEAFDALRKLFLPQQSIDARNAYATQWHAFPAPAHILITLPEFYVLMAEVLNFIHFFSVKWQLFLKEYKASDKPPHAEEIIRTFHCESSRQVQDAIFTHFLPSSLASKEHRITFRKEQDAAIAKVKSETAVKLQQEESARRERVLQQELARQKLSNHTTQPSHPSAQQLPSTDLIQPAPAAHVNTPPIEQDARTVRHQPFPRPGPFAVLPQSQTAGSLFSQPARDARSQLHSPSLHLVSMPTQAPSPRMNHGHHTSNWQNVPGQVPQQLHHRGQLPRARTSSAGPGLSFQYTPLSAMPTGGQPGERRNSSIGERQVQLSPYPPNLSLATHLSPRLPLSQQLLLSCQQQHSLPQRPPSLPPLLPPQLPPRVPAQHHLPSQPHSQPLRQGSFQPQIIGRPNSAFQAYPQPHTHYSMNPTPMHQPPRFTPTTTQRYPGQQQPQMQVMRPGPVPSTAYPRQPAPNNRRPSDSGNIMSAPLPQASATHAISDQHVKLLKSRFFPPKGQSTAQVVPAVPLRYALHQAHLRTPNLVFILGVGAPLERIYQYVSDFAMAPKSFTNATSVLVWTFASRPPPQPPLHPSTHGRVVDITSTMYRLRCVGLAEDVNDDLSAWATKNTFWPQHAYFELNGARLEARMKIGHGRYMPIDVTEMMSKTGENTLKVYCNMVKGPQAHTFAVAIEAVKLISHSAIFANSAAQAIPATETKDSIVQAFNSTNDDEISLSSMTIGLRDPILAAKVWTVPVRGPRCTHRECFDLETFLASRRANRPGEPILPDFWQCPICKADARPSVLRIDGWMADIRRKLVERGQIGGEKEAKAITVSAGAEWEVEFESEGQGAANGGSGDTTDSENVEEMRVKFQLRKRKAVEEIDGGGKRRKVSPASEIATAGITSRRSRSVIEILDDSD